MLSCKYTLFGLEQPSVSSVSSVSSSNSSRRALPRLNWADAELTTLYYLRCWRKSSGTGAFFWRRFKSNETKPGNKVTIAPRCRSTPLASPPASAPQLLSVLCAWCLRAWCAWELACVCVRACLRTYVCTCLSRGFLHSWVCACMRVFVCACMRVCVRPCVRACERSCVRWCIQI